MQEYSKLAKLAEKEVGKLQVSLKTSKIIKNDQDSKRATEFLLKVQTVAKGIKAKKNPIVKSLNDALREVRGLFRPAEDRLQEAEREVKEAIVAYDDKVEAAALREAEKIEKKVDEGKMKLSTGMGKISNIEQASQPIQTKAGSAQFRTIKRIRITDISKLTRYLNRDRVHEAVRIEVAEDVRNGQPVPDGAEQYEEKVVAGIGG